MKRLLIVFLVIGALFIGITQFALSHSGKTDSSGGHYNRKTGEYHYHGSGSTRPKRESSTDSFIPDETEPTPEIWTTARITDELKELGTKLTELHADILLLQRRVDNIEFSLSDKVK